MHTHEYAAAALAELAEELERLSRLGASPDRLEATCAYTTHAVRKLIGAAHRPWLERALADLRLAYGLERRAPQSAGLDPASMPMSDPAAGMGIDTRAPARPELRPETATVSAAPIEHAA